MAHQARGPAMRTVLPGAGAAPAPHLRGLGRRGGPHPLLRFDQRALCRDAPERSPRPAQAGWLIKFPFLRLPLTLEWHHRLWTATSGQSRANLRVGETGMSRPPEKDGVTLH